MGGRIPRNAQLLGLGVIEDAIKHVHKAAAEVNKRAKKSGVGGDLDKIATRLENIENDISKHQDDLDDAKEQFGNFDERVLETGRKIDAALEKGDKEQLKSDLERARGRIKKLDEQLKEANKVHASLFRSHALVADLLVNGGAKTGHVAEQMLAT